MLQVVPRVDQYPLVISSYEGFLRWFERLRWTIEPSVAAGEISEVLAALGAGSLGADDRFRALETMQEAIGFIARSTACDLASAANLLGLNAQAYASLPRAWLVEADSPQRWVDARQRVVQSHTLAVVEHYRRQQWVGAGVWAVLNRAYAQAEADGVAHLSPSASQVFADTRCNARTLYGVAILIALAAPMGESPERFEVIERCSFRFARYLEFPATRETPARAVFGVDLDGDGGPTLLGALDGVGAQVRTIATRALTAELRRVSERMRDGLPPDVLGLSAGPGPGTLKAVLATLRRSWTARADRRPAGRRALRLQGGAVFGFQAVLEAVGSGVGRGSPTARHDALAGPEAREVARATVSGGLGEPSSWHRCEVEDRSDRGLRLCMRDVTGRLRRHELIAVYSDGFGGPLLGRVAWVARRHDSADASLLSVGVRIFEGHPVAARFRFSRPDAVGGSAEVSVMLLASDASPAGKPSFIARRGAIAPDLMGELRSEAAVRQLRAGKLLTVGQDFERFSAAILPQS